MIERTGRAGARATKPGARGSMGDRERTELFGPVGSRRAARDEATPRDRGAFRGFPVHRRAVPLILRGSKLEAGLSERVFSFIQWHLSAPREKDFAALRSVVYPDYLIAVDVP